MYKRQEAIRTPIVKFFVETFEKYSIVTTTGEDPDEAKTRIETEYELGELPEGYESVSYTHLDVYKRQLVAYHYYYTKNRKD